MKKKSLKKEQEAFDNQIIERIKNGHIPDLRFNKKVKYFYNNVWRDPYLVKHTFGNTIKIFNQNLGNESKILEIGCGPGHMSLELARLGHKVCGIDLSPACIDIANRTAKKRAKHLLIEKKLEYRVSNFLNFEYQNNKYDAIVFCGSLSHFTNLSNVFKKINKIVKKKSKILIWDTCIEQYDHNDALVYETMAQFLSLGGNFYLKKNIPKNKKEILKNSQKSFENLRYEDNSGKNLQSPNDNSQNFKSMMKYLKEDYKVKNFEWESSFSRMLVGGIRNKNRKKEKEIINYIWNLEKLMIDSKIIRPAFFHWIGSKKN